MLSFKASIITIVMAFSVGGIAADQRRISDVPSSDPAYGAIYSAVDQGYFTLVDDQKFLPNQSVTRKELAVLIARLDALTTASALSSSDINELKNFSTQFKSYLASQKNEQVLVGSEVTRVKTEQKTLNYDISRLEDAVQQVEKSRKEQQVYLWVALGLGVLGALK
ncbi:MAG: S-layer homology domain-containing protein [Candidatus Marinamargulisbacteria bacterium]